MPTRLVAYETLNAAQRQHLQTLEVHPEQLPFCGDMHCALNTLLAKPNPAVKGFALLAQVQAEEQTEGLADEMPVAFFLLKCAPCLPHWADEQSATLNVLQVDRRAQRQGFGQACLHALPAAARQAWPHVHSLELSVSIANAAALGLYLKLGWVDRGESYKGERRLTLDI